MHRYWVESALTHIYSSILKELDRGRSVFLVMLDLSAAFDTISHERLLHVLDRRFGLRSKALHLIQSYHRVSAVKIQSTLSTFIQTSIGVPRGIILGPVLFSFIMAQLPSLPSNFVIQSHIYAGNTQFWQEFSLRTRKLLGAKFKELLPSLPSLCWIIACS